jgi:hypothetical protein
MHLMSDGKVDLPLSDSAWATWSWRTSSTKRRQPPRR